MAAKYVAVKSTDRFIWADVIIKVQTVPKTSSYSSQTTSTKFGGVSTIEGKTSTGNTSSHCSELVIREGGIKSDPLFDLLTTIEITR